MSCTRSNPPNGYTAENRTSTTLQNRTTSPALERAMVTIAHQDNVLQPTNKLSFISPLQPHHMVESSVGPAPQAANINIGYGETPPCFNPEEEDIEDHVEEFKTWLTASKVPKGDWTKALVRRLPLDGREFIKCRFDPSAALEDVLEALKLCYPRNDGRARSRGNELKKTRRPQSTEDTGRYLMNLITAHATAGEFSPFDSSKEALWALAPKDCLLLAASWSTTRNPEEADFLQAAKFLDQADKWNKERTEAGTNDELGNNYEDGGRVGTKTRTKPKDRNAHGKSKKIYATGRDAKMLHLLPDGARYLTEKDKKFVIGPAEIEAFETLKKKLTEEPILAHFNPDARIEIHTDASIVGLGAVLMQPDNDGFLHPIHYLSRTTSKHESKYGISELECLAIVWALQKLRPYIFGREFKVVTDHSALTWLANVRDPCSRLTRWGLKLMEHDFEIVHRAGRKNVAPDALSRNPFHKNDTNVEDNFNDLTACTVRIDENGQKEDTFCRDITGKLPDAKTRDEYKKINGILYKKNHATQGNQWLVVAPKQSVSEIMKTAHDIPEAGHMGVAKTVHRIKQRFYWKGLEEDVRKYVRSCKVCQAFKPQRFKPAAPLEPLPPATDIWERVGIDHQGPFKKSVEGFEHILTIVDHFSKYALAIPVKDTKAETTCNALSDNLLYVFGTPKCIISDQGKSFDSSTFRDFTRLYGIKHIMASAAHPQTNGLCEKLNGIIKNGIRVYLEDDHAEWPRFVKTATFAYNSSIQSSIKENCRRKLPRPDNDDEVKVKSKMSPGDALIFGQMIKHFGDEAENQLLRILNISWKTGKRHFLPGLMKDQPYDTIIQRIKLHLDPKKKVILQRCRFLKRIQQEAESISEYLRELKHLVINCNFVDMLGTMMRDRFVAGIKSEILQKKLLQEEDDVTLDKVFAVAVSFELAEINTRELQDKLVAKISSVN
ncbi:hypothetical protein LAZ67_4000722 [Cordylochernes scorpioides]|uniref:RNA-directed DNA polymerase n=1 Tax=Cordylochernes scorpioides TaxID=51811 RepID=A0ABY6KCS9_9ARAC|nr:hypothetical protein LAZ67_4000722 [Cordylochernes scorpioides]